ncbi:hypothetical protein FB567DRAFT_99610 [Paraphoma chrysanthemicola]|uniref:RBR-type E3 ubiquitin transferase n=1 Tax=Paraphoma chrysanthemicola TaxID=798071 RepID=A0A8K0QZU3_9PLEO|nr:hypothetical protein FB567DRAFT_99610 [Paraphoma chrysanthemicola]
MGSKFSRIRRQHVKAAASVVPAATRHDINQTNEGGPCQDPAPQIHSLVLHISTAPVPDFRDDSKIATSTTSTENSSARARSASFDTANNMAAVQRLRSNFEQFLEEQRLRGIVYETQPSAPPVLHPPPVETVQPPPIPPIPEPQCLTCCKAIPKEEDPNYSKEALKPCRFCKHDYCTECVKNMFIEACKDLSRMPPRCCVPINLHVARPYLTEEEAQLFRQKYEEWSTQNPFYCPVPVCSAFIPERLLPHSARINNKQRVDSGVGTPTAASFECPTCDASICTECRQVAHPGNICSITEFGLDAETAALFKSWGYKKCPKCGHGVKRMFGCNHMECRCGSHFCWSCLENIETCDGGCADDDDEYDDDEPEEDGEEDEENNVATTSTAAQATDIDAGESATPATVAAAPTQERSRPRNLDGGGAHYWQNADLDFGDEPTDEHQDRAWDCRHFFSVFKVPFTAALGSQTNDMECVKCWSIIRPEIEPPKTAAADEVKSDQAAIARDRPFRGRGGIGRRGRGRGGRARYQPPRGLFRADATIGTAPHLTAIISSTTQGISARETLPMEGIITAVFQEPSTHRSATPSSPKTNIFNTEVTPHSLAHECYNCRIIVCETCKSHAVAAQEEKDEAAKRAAQEALDQAAREQEEIDALPLTLPLPEPESETDPNMSVGENTGTDEGQSVQRTQVEERAVATPMMFD